MLLLHILLGWLIADALSGILHYVLDHYGDEQTPFVGTRAIRYAREHHVRPLAFTQWGWFARHINTWLAVWAVGIVWLLVLGPSVILVVALIGGMISPSVHYWAHSPRYAPCWAKSLQRWGAFQSPKGHARHHRPPYTAHYCVLTDWLNWILTRKG